MKLFTTTILSLLMLPLLGGGVLANGYDSEKNHPSYWGDDCYKIEVNEDIKEYTVNDTSATRVIIKGGTANKVYEEGPFVDLQAELNPRSGKPYGISHVIICSDQVDSPDEPADNGQTNDDGDEQPQVAGESTGKDLPDTLPATGAPVALHLGIGTLISTTAGWISLRRQE